MNSRLILCAGLLITVAAAPVQAASTSEITPTITFTLTDIKVGGMSATEFDDYEADGPVEASSSFSETFLFGGTGSTSGSSSSSQNGSTIDPMVGGDPLAVGDTLTMTLNSLATANTGYVNRDQFEYIGFQFYNFTDDGFGVPETLSFLFDYTLSYTTSLSNDVAGDQAAVRFNMTATLYDDDFGPTAVDLFPQDSMDEVSEISFAAGTVTPGGMLNGSFALELAGSSGFFDFEATGITPTSIKVVPVPAAVWLFGSALGLLGWMRRKG